MHKGLLLDVGPFKDAVAVTVAVEGVVAAFVIAAKTILITMAPSKSNQRFQAEGLVPTIQSMTAAANVAMVASLTGAVLVAMSGLAGSMAYACAANAWVGIVVSSCALYVIFANTFFEWTESVAKSVEKEAIEALERAKKEEKMEADEDSDRAWREATGQASSTESQ